MKPIPTFGIPTAMLLAATSASSRQGSPSPTGDWHATMNAGGRQISFAIHIEQRQGPHGF